MSLQAEFVCAPNKLSFSVRAYGFYVCADLSGAISQLQGGGRRCDEDLSESAAAATYGSLSQLALSPDANSRLWY